MIKCGKVVVGGFGNGRDIRGGGVDCQGMEISRKDKGHALSRMNSDDEEESLDRE